MAPRIIQLIREGKVDKVQRILDDKVSTRRTFLDHTQSYLHEFIGLAARHGRIEILERCVDYGVEIEIGTNYGLHALVGAASKGHDHIIKWLLKPWVEDGRIIEGQEHSDKVDIPQDWLCPSLHKAVRGRHVETVKLLVQEAWANVNACEGDKLRPIHVAADNVDKENPEQMSRYEEIVDILVAADARVDDLNPLTETTPLYDAVIRNSRAATTRLIDGGADVFRKISETKRTVLHVAAEAGFHETLQTILDHDRFRGMGPEAFDLKDEEGRTPLYLAADGGHLECMRVLIKKGLNLASEDAEGVTVIKVLFKHVARPVEFLTEILDDQVSATDNTGNNVILDFRILTNEHSRSDSEVVSALIDAVPSMEHMTILQHPLLETFLHLQYLPIMPYDSLLLLVHILFVSLLFWQVRCSIPGDKYCPNYVKPLLFASSMIFLVDSVLRMLVGLLSENANKLQKFLLSASCFISTVNLIFVMITMYDVSRTHPDSYYSSNVTEISGIVILCSWMNVMLVLTRFPSLGEYTYLFFAVLMNVGKVLFAFACPIVGFALSFSILFSGNDPSSAPLKTLVKALAVMTGEYDYDSFHTLSERNGSTVVNNSVSGVNNGGSLQTAGTIIALMFVMVTGIALMNLMVGLAVTDIQEFLKMGRSRRLMKQVESVTLSSSRPTERIPRTIKLDLKSSTWFPWLEIPVDVKRALSKLALRNFNRNERPQMDYYATIEKLISLKWRKE